MTNNNTLSDTIQNQIENTINTQPYPTQATITKVYQDGHVDAETQYGKLTYIQSILTHEIDDETILIFLNNDYNKRMII